MRAIAPGPNFLTLDQVAATLQTSRRTIQRYIQAGQLRVRRFSKKNVRIERVEFERFVKGTGR